MPVIRVSDYVMNILKKYAIPLEDNADSVLRKILEEYDELKQKATTQMASTEKINHARGHKYLTSNIESEIDSPVQKSLTSKGATTMENLSPQELGRLCRKALKKHLGPKWGNFDLMKSWLIQTEGKDKILSLYSSKDKTADKWFYGIIQKDWQRWDNNSYLSLLMRDGSHCSFVLLTPDESKKLLDRLTPAKDLSKKINVRMPSTGRIYIEKWPDYPLAERIVEMEDAIE